MTTDGAPAQPGPGDINARDISFYLTHLARDSARFVEVLRQTPPESRVPTCPDWDADDLLWHLAGVQWFWGTIVGRGLTAGADVDALDNGGRPVDRDDLLAFYDQASRDLHQILSTTPDDKPVWTWSDDHTVGFIRRRQAHEALIHRLDAELTAGDRTPMDPELSTDGVDEALYFLGSGVSQKGRFTPDPTKTVRVRTTDTGRSWLATLGQLTGTEGEGVVADSTVHDKPGFAVAHFDSGGPTAATLSGAAADLDCWLWHRPPTGEVERNGDPQVLQCFDQIIAPGI